MQEEQFNQWLKITFYLNHELLSMGEDVEAMAPLSFRKEMKNIFNKMISNYI